MKIKAKKQTNKQINTFIYESDCTNWILIQSNEHLNQLIKSSYIFVRFELAAATVYALLFSLPLSPFCVLLSSAFLD